MANPEINIPISDPEEVELGMEGRAGVTIPAPVDPSLTVSGKAADAKAAGDAIRANAAAIETLEAAEEGKVAKPETNPDGTAGQLLRTNGDGTTQWVDQGTPTAEQVGAAVDAWLDDHPEATTTVEDGAIGWDKLHPALKLAAELIPGTTQVPAYNAEGVLHTITHQANGAAVRTDTITRTDEAVTETRVLSTGQRMTITTNRTTKQTSVVYSDQ